MRLPMNTFYSLRLSAQAPQLSPPKECGGRGEESRRERDEWSLPEIGAGDGGGVMGAPISKT